MDKQTIAEVDKVIKRVARAYLCKCTWADERELIQEGWVTALEVHKKYQPQTLDHTRALTWTVVSFTMRRHLWWACTPVTTKRLNRQRCLNLKAVTLESTVQVRNPRTKYFGESMFAKNSYLLERLREQLWNRAIVLLKDKPVECRPYVEGVLAILLDGEKSEESAYDRVLDIWKLYEHTKRYKNVLVRDQVVCHLLAEILEQDSI